MNLDEAVRILVEETRMTSKEAKELLKGEKRPLAHASCSDFRYWTASRQAFRDAGRCPCYGIWHSTAPKFPEGHSNFFWWYICGHVELEEA